MEPPIEPIKGWRIGEQQQVVLGVLLMLTVAIGAAIFFPAFARAKNRAHQRTCVSNLTQLGAALRKYARTHDGKLFIWDDLGGAIPPYVTEPLECPTTRHGYITNDHLVGKSLQDIANPAETPVAWDCWVERDKRGYPPHSGGLNILFLNGRVTWLPEDELKRLIRGRDSDAAVPSSR